ncbi:MAG: hypothetical protein ACT4NV_16830, partial [Rhodoferax sp.]
MPYDLEKRLVIGVASSAMFWVFRTNVTGDSGIVTADSGERDRGDSGIVTGIPVNVTGMPV